MIRRGDVVIVDFRYASGGSKKRPAVVVQSDALNAKLSNTVLAMITGNTKYVGKEPAQFLIDPATPEGRSSGLSYATAVKCHNLMTIEQANLLQTVGHLSDALKLKLNDCLKAALELP